MNTQYLSSESSLQGGRYRIVRMLGSGGFGITYLGTQTGLERNIVIKEFFMTDYCLRDEYSNLITVPTVSNVEFVERFKDKFLKEARHIAQLKHPNIVNIIDVFEENGTAYYVMDFIEGGSLVEKVQREGSLPENVAKRYILQIADALNYIHQRYMNHLDVKPGNIMLSRNDNAILIDFGLSKQYDSQTGHQTSTTPVGISHGYAPMEQYKEGGVSEFSPETDIYSLGATLYYLLTGARPPVSQEINEDGLPLDQLKAKNISWPTISAIINAMKPRRKERTHDINTFIAELNAGTEGDITGPGNTGAVNTGQGYAAPRYTTDPGNTGPGYTGPGYTTDPRNTGPGNTGPRYTTDPRNTGSGNTGQETGQWYQQTPSYGNQQNKTVVDVFPPTPDYNVNTSGKRTSKLVIAILCGVAVSIFGTGILLSMCQGASEAGKDWDDTLLCEDSCEVDSLAIDSALYADSIAAADSLAAIAEEPKPEQQQKISTPTEKKEATPRKTKTRQSSSSTKSSTTTPSRTMTTSSRTTPPSQPAAVETNEPPSRQVRNDSYYNDGISTKPKRKNRVTQDGIR
ncbi:MAG: serine/threonine-protein kinase [Bacteroidales bacterium]|nr:serine/threonine-protein kinase [Bacteroidales bacterium]MDY2704387.1 serine/threonine-protein kinase [Alloprevotella sp.]